MRYPRLLLALVMVCAGCTSVAPPAEPEARTVEADVVQAVRFAFGLEAALFANADVVASRTDVAAHFRQGFGADLADDFADYFWHRDRLRTGEPALVVPDSVTVFDAAGDTARAYFPTPSALRSTWDLPRYTVVSLRRTGTRWIVTSTEPREEAPR